MLSRLLIMDVGNEDSVFVKVVLMQQALFESKPQNSPMHRQTGHEVVFKFDVLHPHAALIATKPNVC